MTWYIMYVEGNDWGEPSLIGNPVEEATHIYEELKDYIEGRKDFRDRVEYLEDEMGDDTLPFVRSFVEEEISLLLQHEDDEDEVHGITFEFDRFGWGREEVPSRDEW